MLTVCIALSYCQITFFKVKHSCLKSVPSLSGSLPLHHKILQLGHYGCLLLVYFCAGYLGTSPCLWFIWFIPNFTSENSNDQGRIFFFSFFLHLPACNITYNFHQTWFRRKCKICLLPNFLSLGRYVPFDKKRGV